MNRSVYVVPSCTQSELYSEALRANPKAGCDASDRRRLQLACGAIRAQGKTEGIETRPQMPCCASSGGTSHGVFPRTRPTLLCVVGSLQMSLDWLSNASKDVNSLELPQQFMAFRTDFQSAGSGVTVYSPFTARAVLSLS